MNQRNAMPARGMRSSAIAIVWACTWNKVDAADGCLGKDALRSAKIATNSSEKTTPEIAAAVGGLNLAAVGCSALDAAPSPVSFDVGCVVFILALMMARQRFACQHSHDAACAAGRSLNQRISADMFRCSGMTLV